MAAKIVLLCGLPGAGKTTEAVRMVNAGEVDQHVEADHWMVDAGGFYRFDRRKLPMVHKKCQELTEEIVKRGRSVVVANTFTTEWERNFYRAIAKRLGCPIEVRRMDGEYPNIHNVPGDTIEKMRKRWEDIKSV